MHLRYLIALLAPEDGAGASLAPAAEAAAPAKTAEATSKTPAEDDAAPADGAAPAEEAQADSDATKGEDDKPEDGDEKPLTAESYGEFTLPEGFTADPEISGEFKAFAAEHKISPEAAQGLIDLQVKLMQKQVASHRAAIDQWAKDARADKEVGGANFDKNLGVARAALDAFGSPELVEILNNTGLGNHRAVLSAFYRMGKAMGEGSRVGPAGASGSQSAMSEEAYMRRVFNSGNEE